MAGWPWEKPVDGSRGDVPAPPRPAASATSRGACGQPLRALPLPVLTTSHQAHRGYNVISLLTHTSLCPWKSQEVKELYLSLKRGEASPISLQWLSK